MTIFQRVSTFCVLTSLVCLAIGAASCRGADAPAGKLVIVKAVYGDLPDGAKTDVTEKVAAMVKDNALSVFAGNDNFGDPAGGVAKKLRVVFTIDGVAASKTVDAGETLTIAAAERALVLHLRQWQESADTRIEELTWAIQRRPNNVELLVSVLEADGRGSLYARRGKFKEALADYSKAVQLDPSHHWRWFQLLSLRAYLGDLDGYRKDCADMLQRFGDSDGGVAERLGKVGLLIADQRIDQTAACEMADRSMKVDLPGWNVLTKGIAEYRRGNYASAVPFLKQSREHLRPRRAGDSNEYYPFTTAGAASAEFVLAMACHRLKQPDEAGAAMARGVALMDELPRAGVDDLTNPFHEALITHVFRREAEQLILGKPPATQPSGNSK
ncbi:MAG: tetratricopeptide repeat protein [Tepidisphaerales bacterium]